MLVKVLLKFSICLASITGSPATLLGEVFHALLLVGCLGLHGSSGVRWWSWRTSGGGHEEGHLLRKPSGWRWARGTEMNASLPQILAPHFGIPGVGSLTP